MGYTDFSPFEVQSLISEMAKRWPGRDTWSMTYSQPKSCEVPATLFAAPKEYNVLNKNCCHFSDELCQLLGVGQLPSWVLA